MLTSVTGTFENGNIKLNEMPSSFQRANVIVTFLEDISKKEDLLSKRPLGTLKGQIKMSVDFDAPLDDLKDYM